MPLYEVRDHILAIPCKVVKFIGAGGMGSVYEVEDTSIGKHYVLKTLHVDFAKGEEGPKLQQMMLREARALAQVAHPHIVDVITAGKTADRHGLPFIVMEKLEGVTVRTMLRSVSLPRQAVWQIANELLDALYHLHHPADGRPPMLHRDIKPENIFLAKKHDQTYITKLLDLGIAVILDGGAHGAHGTPAYMAPEQCRNERLTERTDLYQATCVIFEMLTGRHPFHGAKTASEWVEAHLLRDPPRASAFVDVPKRVDDVLFAALSKDPTERPRDAHALMAGLHELREANDPAAPLVANTTVEDLHTAIERRGESGYEAYATGTGMLDGMDAPPAASTLRDATRSLATATTEQPDEPALDRGAPASVANKRRPVRMERQHDGAPARVDRSAPTRSVRDLVIRRAPQNDTEEIAVSEIFARAARSAMPGAGGAAPPAQSDEPVATTNGTPLAAEVAPAASPRRSSVRAGPFIALAASVFIAVVVFGPMAARLAASGVPAAASARTVSVVPPSAAAAAPTRAPSASEASPPPSPSSSPSPSLSASPAASRPAATAAIGPPNPETATSAPPTPGVASPRSTRPAGPMPTASATPATTQSRHLLEDPPRPKAPSVPPPAGSAASKHDLSLTL